VKLIPRTNKQVFLVLTLFTGLNAGVMYQLIPQPDHLTTTQEKTDTWQVAQLNKENVQAQYNQLRQLQPWGKEEPEGPTKEELAAMTAEKQVVNDIKWQFMGVVKEGGKKFILVQAENDTKVKRYTFGKPLPDNSEILAIYDYRVEVRKNGKKSVIELFNIEK